MQQKFKIGERVYYANGRLHGWGNIMGIKGEFVNGDYENPVGFKYNVWNDIWLGEGDIFTKKQDALEKVIKLF